MSLEESDPDISHHANTYHLVEKMVKIGPVDPEIIVLK